MKNAVGFTPLAVVAVGLVLSVSPLRIEAQDREKLLRLEIVRTDGIAEHYQPIALNNATVQFSERGRSLWCESDLVDYGVTKDEKGQLTHAGVTVYTNAKRGWVFHGPAGISVSKCTSYTDLDGDSVFDTMVKEDKDSPDPRDAYILHEGSWIKVVYPQHAWSVGVLGFNQNRYGFNKGKWEITKKWELGSALHKSHWAVRTASPVQTRNDTLDLVEIEELARRIPQLKEGMTLDAALNQLRLPQRVWRDHIGGGPKFGEPGSQWAMTYSLGSGYGLHIEASSSAQEAPLTIKRVKLTVPVKETEWSK